MNDKPMLRLPAMAVPEIATDIFALMGAVGNEGAPRLVLVTTQIKQAPKEFGDFIRSAKGYSA